MTDTSYTPADDDVAVTNNSLREEIAFVRKGLFLLAAVHVPVWIGLVGLLLR